MALLRKWRFILVALLASFLFTGCTLPWQKNIAGLQIQITDGTSAQIFLNDLHLGSTPIEKDDLKTGVYKLKIVPDTNLGKQPYETEIHLYPGALTSVLWSFKGSDPSGTGDILELEPLSTKERAELAVITVPEGASVALNSTTYGLSPVILDTIEPGEYSLTVTAVGHVRKTFSAKVSKGYRLHVFSRLEKEGGETVVLPTPTPEPTPTPLVLSNDGQPTPRPTPVPTPSPTPISAVKPATTSATLQKPYVTIKDTGTGWLRVRSEPKTSNPIDANKVGEVTVGASYPYISSVNGWYEIEYLTGKTGWITGQYATLVR